MPAIHNLRKRPIASVKSKSPAKRSRSNNISTPCTQLSTIKKACVIQELPFEILLFIFELTDFNAKLSLEQVCRKWREIVCTNIWPTMTSLNMADLQKGLNYIHGYSKSEKRIQHKIFNVARKCAPYLKELNLNETCHRIYNRWRDIMNLIPVNQLQHFESLTRHVSTTQLGQIAGRFQSLKSIAIDTRCITSMTNLFKTCTNLEKVYLQRGCLSKKSFCYLPLTLRSLKLDDCIAIGDTELASIGARCPKLVSLELKRVSQNLDFNSLFSKLNNLESVTLKAKGEFENSNVRLLSLGSLLRLTHLELCFQQFLTDSLLESIGQCGQLKTLHLFEFGNFAPNYSLDGLLHLGNLTQLENLTLYKIEAISDLALKRIAKNNIGLKKVRIPFCHMITDDAIIFLLEHCNQLHYLDVFYCTQLTEKVLERIVEKLVLKHGTNLPAEPLSSSFHLFLLGTHISEENANKYNNPWLTVSYRGTSM